MMDHRNRREYVRFSTYVLGFLASRVSVCEMLLLITIISFNVPFEVFTWSFGAIVLTLVLEGVLWSFGSWIIRSILIGWAQHLKRQIERIRNE